MNFPKEYAHSLTKYSRFLTREVTVGDLKIGGLNPIRLQSMTTTDTMDTEATIAQSIRMIEAGCELVRITAPSMNEAKNLEWISKGLKARGYTTPICADIHFTPNAAEFAARVVEKVRVNPGNYADKKKFETLDYTDLAYEAELERIRNRFTPLVKICKEYGTAMRIGTNHGSLSDRILSRYGDTPLGMVESALEFLRICEENNYYNLVISMKASNTQVMVQAYRLLVAQMMESNRAYPLHLGVTEAGDGEDGRVKSAVGIGTLLEDGIGDTIRVSLTEEPEFEIPVAKILAERYTHVKELVPIPEIKGELPYTPYEYCRNLTQEVNNLGGHQVPRVVADYSEKKEITPASLFGVGYIYSVPLDKWNLTDQAVDYLFVGDSQVDFEIPGTLGLICSYANWLKNKDRARTYPLFLGESYFTAENTSPHLNFLSVNISGLTDDFIQRIKQAANICLVFDALNPHAMPELRRMATALKLLEYRVPFILKCNYVDLTEAEFQLYSSTDFGGVLLDGFGDGIWIHQTGCVSTRTCNSTAFSILQAARTRISKTEYISCPSCGRTLFDLQETTQRIRERTDHLKGIKIGIMGCIVNGPGEMADADYGYVGTGPGKISLYKGKEVIKKNVTSESAVDELIELIREHGDWIEKSGI